MKSSALLFFFRKDNNMKENVEVIVKVGLGDKECG